MGVSGAATADSRRLMTVIDIFPWDAHFETGIARIDAQHQTLVALLNTLARHAVTQTNGPAPLEVLDELAAYTEDHFRCEEDIWTRYLPDEPMVVSHILGHETFIKTIARMRADHLNGLGAGLLSEILAFLTRWLAAHILQSDRYAAHVVRGLEEGLELTAAKQRAEQQMGGAARHLIEIILALYEKLSSNALALMREIADRKTLNSALSESEHEIHAIIESTADMIWVVDAEDFGLRLFNRPMADYFVRHRGLQLEHGMTPEMLVPDPDTEAYWRRLFRRALEEGPFSAEYATLAGGHVLLLNVNPVRRNGRIYAISVFGRDITDGKRTQRRLQSMVEDLELSNREMERFTHVATHDLQEPLRIITSFSQLLSRTLKPRLNDQESEHFGFIMEAARRMSVLIRGLVSFSRAGGDAGAIAPLPLDEICSAALHTLAERIGATQARITRSPLPTLPGDAVQLRQLFEQLLGNALKFHRPGQVPEITIGAERQGGLWRIDVRDNGIGIADNGEDIFEIFQRPHAAGHSERGVGLAICRRIVRRHQGRIWVTSREGEGATFSFTLPE